MSMTEHIQTEELLEHLNQGRTVADGSGLHKLMVRMAEDAMRITMELNSSYHGPEEIRRLMSELTGKEVDASFRLFPPFYTEFGKNIHIGKNVFINCCCHFQDQGGVYIGDGTLIGSHVVFATINHSQCPGRRADNHPAPIRIGKNAWIGSHVTILPSVSVGDHAIVAAGAVVTKDVPAMSVVGGVPARMLKAVPSGAEV
ncbi:MAG: sugar O-acetyltransferase [Roseburia sp.]|nr:sugar O-acetyltransferase [Roseburia sp.]